MATYDWIDRNLLPNGVFSDFSPLKILLKTKDDPWLVRRWFEHHSRIVGPENIVIFDNGSTDASVLAFYAEISGTTSIVRNNFVMDWLHHSHSFTALYDALVPSCRLFCFLDTDEFLLCLSDERTLMRPEDITSLSAVFDDDGPDYWPGLWLHNAFKSETTFKLNGQQGFRNCLLWGKPLISAKNMPVGIINHNIQVAKLTRNVASFSPFIVLHARDLFPEQRIAAAMKKLAAFNYITPGMRPEDVASLEFDSVPAGNPKQWASEIAHLLAVKDRPEERGEIRIDDTGRIEFGDAVSEACISTLYRDPEEAYIDCGLISAPADLIVLRREP